MPNKTALATIGSAEELMKRLEADAMQNMILQIAPKQMTPGRVAKMAVLAVRRNEDLLKCTWDSIGKAISQAAELGLDFSGALGRGWLVPYGNQCQFIPGYRGLMDLARRGGLIKDMTCQCVYDKDDFDVDYGRAEDPVRHKPYLDGDRGKLKFVWARATFKGGGQQVEFMSIDQIDKIAKASPGYTKGPWKTHYDEMARKTTIRRLCKYLPMNAHLGSALDILDEHDRKLSATQIIDVDPDGSRTEALAKTLSDKATQKAEDIEPSEVSQERTTPTGQMTEHQKVALNLAEVCDCDLPAAIKRLNDFSTKTLGHPYDKLSAETLGHLKQKIAKGEIRVEKEVAPTA